MMKRIVRSVLISILGLGAPVAALAGIFSYTGKYKIHEDKCYEQVNVSGKGFEWREFNCIERLEHSYVQSQILNELNGHSSLNLEKGAITKSDFLEIV